MDNIFVSMNLRFTKFPSLLFDIMIGALLCFPILSGPTSKLLGSPKVDVWNHVWGPWWWKHSLLDGSIPWRTTMLKWPEGGVLWFIDPVLAVVGAPLTLLSPVLAYNLVMLAYAAFASWSARRFARSLGANGRAEWLASIGFVLSGWMIGEMHNGISEAVNIGPAALALAWTEDACRAEGSERKAWLKAGLGVGLCFLASPYLGMGVSIAAGIRGFPHIRNAWAGACSAALVALPPLLALRGQLNHYGAIIKRPEGMNEQLSLHNAVDIRTFFAPLGFQSRDLSGEGFYHSMYLGLAMLILASLSLRRHRLWLAALLVCLTMSLGPYLYWGDGWMVIANARIRLPWWFLQQAIPGLAITHPLRLAIPCLAIVAAVAAVEASKVKWYDKVPFLGLAIALDGLLLCGAPWPIQTADATIPNIYTLIQRDSREVGILDLPTDSGSTMEASRYLYYQTYHQKPIPYAPDVRASTSSLLRYNAFRRLAAMCKRRADEDRALALGRSFSGSDQVKTLRPAEIGWVVLHHEIDPIATQKLGSLLRLELGNGVTIGNATAWKLDLQEEQMPSPQQ
jgi:hypothetical protein